MLRMIHYAVARRATRFFAVPAMALVAGAALVSIGVSAGTIPTAFTARPASRGCGTGHPTPCGQAPDVTAMLKSLGIHKATPIKALPAHSFVRQAISPTTPAEQARMAQLRRALATR